MSFSKRLKEILEQKNLTQAEVAKLCGVSQQSINYIINNKLKSSKLAPILAEALKINPEWLTYGKGRQETAPIYELPILHSVYMLKKFTGDTLPHDNLEFTTIDQFLGPTAFAYLLKPTKMIICTDKRLNKRQNTLFLITMKLVSNLNQRQHFMRFLNGGNVMMIFRKIYNKFLYWADTHNFNLLKTTIEKFELEEQKGKLCFIQIL